MNIGYMLLKLKFGFQKEEMKLSVNLLHKCNFSLCRPQWRFRM